MKKSAKKRNRNEIVTVALMKEQGLWFQPQAPETKPFTASRQTKGVTVGNLPEHFREFK